jgi:hypothetical protein
MNQRITDIIAANCLTVGIVLGISLCLTLDVQRTIQMNGVFYSYKLRLSSPLRLLQ